MYKKYLNCYNILITGLLTLALGILIIVLNQKFLLLIVYLVSIILMVYAVSNVIKLITKKCDKHKRQGIIIQTILNTAISIVFCSIPNISLPMFSLIFGLYILFNSAVKLVNYIIFRINKIQGRLGELFVFLVYIGFGLSFIFLPNMNLNTILIIIGIYFILLGVTYIWDFSMQMVPIRHKNKFKRKFRITLPVFLSVLIPHDTLNQINKSLNTDSYTPKKIFKKDEKERPDLEILIHVTKKGMGVTGHADMYFENKIYSYGNYDYNSIKLFEAIGDGVLFIADDKEKYINFCIEDSKKTLFGFGLKLTEKQKEAIREKIDKIMENAYKWDGYKEKEYKKNKFYATRLSKAVKTAFFKFKKGKFKTFFILNTNCVQLVDTILGATGTDILNMNGIITPGTYYDFLATEYTKKNSNVISYKIYK